MDDGFVTGTVGLADWNSAQTFGLSACTTFRYAMSTITFDTLRFVETLEKAGMPRAQAAAFSQAQRDSLAEALDTTVATKADIVRLENRMDSMTKDMQAKELRLTIKLGAFLAVFAGIIIAALRAF